VVGIVDSIQPPPWLRRREEGEKSIYIVAISVPAIQGANGVIMVVSFSEFLTGFVSRNKPQKTYVGHLIKD
jgi:hypothetical protein